MLLNVTKEEEKKINPCVSVQYLEKFNPKNSVSSLHMSHGAHQFHCSKSIRLRDCTAFRKERARGLAWQQHSSIPLLGEVTPSSSPELCLDSDSAQAPSTEWDFKSCFSHVFDLQEKKKYMNPRILGVWESCCIVFVGFYFSKENCHNKKLINNVFCC